MVLPETSRQESNAQLIAADSFRAESRDGVTGVRAWELHRARFTAAVTSLAPELTAALPDFLHDAAEQIATAGNGFPRLELWRDSADIATLSLALRELPALGTPVDLWVAPPKDPVRRQLKGPNIAQFAALNRALDGEALLVDLAGNVLEGATTSLLWWEDQTLCVVGDLRRVASVTEHLVLEVAAASDVTVTETRVAPHQLAQHEVWAVNALHSIRAVRSIDGKPLAPLDEVRLARYQAALDARWAPLTGSPDSER